MKTTIDFDIAWHDVSEDFDGQPGSKLLAHIVLLGTNMHLEAFRIANDENIQRVHDERLQPDVDKYFDASVMVATPYGT